MNRDLEVSALGRIICLSRSKALLSILALVALPSSSFGQPLADKYFCITDQSSGFAFDKASQRWISTVFTPGRKWIFRHIRADEAEKYPAGTTWILTPFGEEYAWVFCTREIPEEQSKYIACDGVTSLTFSAKTLRFQIFYSWGYVSPWDSKEGDDTPNIQIGTCAPI